MKLQRENLLFLTFSSGQIKRSSHYHLNVTSFSSAPLPTEKEKEEKEEEGQTSLTSQGILLQKDGLVELKKPLSIAGEQEKLTWISKMTFVHSPSRDGVYLKHFCLSKM